jgi:hypothetical protein
MIVVPESHRMLSVPDMAKKVGQFPVKHFCTYIKVSNTNEEMPMWVHDFNEAVALCFSFHTVGKGIQGV